jgi:hypothetical protein
MELEIKHSYVSIASSGHFHYIFYLIRVRIRREGFAGI